MGKIPTKSIPVSAMPPEGHEVRDHCSHKGEVVGLGDGQDTKYGTFQAGAYARAECLEERIGTLRMEAVMVAVERARDGRGPSFIECKTIRTGPHATVFVDKVHGQPRDPKKLEEMKKRDPVVLYRNRLLEQGVLTAADVERIAKEVAEEVAETEHFVNESPILDDPSALDRALYAE